MNNLPHSEEHERAVLSCVLMDGAAALSQALDAKITEEVFYDSRHKRVWKGILWLHGRGMPLELSVLAEELKKGNRLEEVGGYEGLVAATQGQPTSLTYAYSLEKLKELYMLRRLIGIADETKEKALAYSGSVDDFVSKMSAALAIKNEAEKSKGMEDIIDALAASCSRIMEGKGSDEDLGMPFPWIDWNKLLGTAKGGELIIIAARPGVGKSSAARQIAWNWSKGGDVLYFSHEMTAKTVYAALAQMLSKVSYRSVIRNEIRGNEGKEFLASLAEVKKRKSLHVYDSDMTFAQVTSRIQAVKQVAKIKAIFVDYLQIQDPMQERGETRDIALGRMSKGYKHLANSLDIPVIVLSQLSRGVEKESRAPRLSDLRETGNLEQDADRVIFLHAPATNPRTGETQELNGGTGHVYVEAIQAKGRSDGQHTAELLFDRKVTTFNNLVL